MTNANGNLALNDNMAAIADGNRLRKGLGASHSNKRLPSFKQGSSSLVMEMGRYSNVGA
jgi:hypothetical protein